MGIYDSDFGDGLAQKALILVGAVVIGSYLFQIGWEAKERADRKDFVRGSWSAACDSERGPVFCDPELEAHEDACFKQAREMRNQTMLFSRVVFFQCMNERNSAGIQLPVPEPTGWELGP